MKIVGKDQKLTSSKNFWISIIFIYTKYTHTVTPSIQDWIELYKGMNETRRVKSIAYFEKNHSIVHPNALITYLNCGKSKAH